MRILRLSGSRFLMFCLMAGLAGTCIAGVSVQSAETVSKEELIANMIDAQKDLQEWRARARFEIRVGSVTLPLGMEVFCRRPDRMALKFVGVVIRPSGGFLFPDPVWFESSPGYELQVTGSVVTRDCVLHTLAARPDGHSSTLSWEFVVHGSTWLVVRATASLGEESSNLHISYTRVGDNCWIIDTIRGQGVLLLRDAVPASVLRWVSDAAGPSGVSYTVTLSGHRVNEGLPPNLFRP